jgi:hypothetical protein
MLEAMNQQRLFAPVVVVDQSAAPVAPLPSAPIAPVVVVDQSAAPVAPLPSAPIAPVVVVDQSAAPVDFEYPPMPSPQPLYAYGQQLYPVPSDDSFTGLLPLNEFVANLQIHCVLL